MVKKTASWLAKTGAALCVSGILLSTVHADNSAPVELIVPYAPGGASDIIVRAMAPHLSKALQQNIVVVNRPGANSAIGATQLARSAPNGKVLMLADAALVLNVAVRDRSPGYDVATDFSPIMQIGSAPLVLFTAASGSADLASFMEKGKQGTINIANAGPGSLGHLAAELLRLRSGANITSVPYRGSGPAMNETLGGQVDATFTSTASGMPLVESGQLKAVAVAAQQKIEDYPNIPTFKSAGLEGVEAINWWGIMGPAGLDKATSDRIAAAVREAMSQPELQKRFAMLGIAPTMRDAGEFRTMMQRELQQWKRVVLEAGIKVD